MKKRTICRDQEKHNLGTEVLLDLQELAKSIIFENNTRNVMAFEYMGPELHKSFVKSMTQSSPSE
jgi:hypothetical protein